MEKYINDNTVVDDEMYKAFKDFVKCPVCHNILINPMMCMGCQKAYCKKCVNEWSKNDDRCPTRCKNPTYQKSLEKNNMLSKLKFKCEKCGEKVDYESIEKHMEICDKDNINNIKKSEEKNNNINNINKQKIKKIEKHEVERLTKGRKLPNITCKKNLFHVLIYINIVITLGVSNVGKSSLINT